MVHEAKPRETGVSFRILSVMVSYATQVALLETWFHCCKATSAPGSRLLDALQLIVVDQLRLLQFAGDVYVAPQRMYETDSSSELQCRIFLHSRVARRCKRQQVSGFTSQVRRRICRRRHKTSGVLCTNRVNCYSIVHTRPVKS